MWEYLWVWTMPDAFFNSECWLNVNNITW